MNRKRMWWFGVCLFCAFIPSERLQAQSFAISNTQVQIAVAPGFDHLPVPVKVDYLAPGFDWSGFSVTSDASWVTATSVPSNREIELTFRSSNLVASSYTATITARQGTNVDSFFVSATVSPLSVFRLVDDPFRSRVYGVAQNGVGRGSVVVFEPISGRPIGNVSVGQQPTDLEVSTDGTELFVINVVDKSVSVIDLRTLRITQTLLLPQFENWGVGSTTANIGVGPGRILYYTDGAWAPVLRVLDRDTLTVLQSLMISGSSGYGVGDFAVSGDRSMLWGWAQYGWSAGMSDSSISRFSVSASGILTHVEQTGSSSSTALARDPLESPVLVSADDRTVFVKQLAVDAAGVSTTRQGFSSTVYAITPGGELVATENAFYETLTGKKLCSLPVTTTVMTISSDYGRLVCFNPSTRALQSFNLFDLVSPGVLDSVYTPADGSIVLSPVQLDWPSVPGADVYDVYLGTADMTGQGTNSPAYRGRVVGSSYELPAALPPGVTYFWRVDVAGEFGVSTGAVHRFTVSLLSSSLNAIQESTLQGHSNYQVAVALDSASTGTAWSATSSVSWISFVTNHGATPATLTVILNAAPLSPGVHTAQVSLASDSAAAFILPVTLTVDSPRYTVIRSDPLSRYVYAVSESVTNSVTRTYLVEVDAEQEIITRIVRTGLSVTDLAIHQGDHCIYVPNWVPGTAGAIQAVDRTSFQVARTYTLQPFGSFYSYDAYRLTPGAPGRLIFEGEDQWVSAVIFNTTTGTNMASASLREGGGGATLDGAVYYHGDNNISSASLRKFDLVGDVFTSRGSARVASYSGYGSRTVVVSEDGRRIFWNGGVFSDGLTVLWDHGRMINAATPDGGLAFGTEGIYDTVAKQQVLTMPTGTAICAYNSTARKLVVPQEATLGFYPISQPLSLAAPVLSLVARGTNRLTVGWTDRTLETRFTLQFRVQGAGVWTDFGTGVAANARSATVTGLVSTTTYELRIKADSPVVSSDWSGTLTAATLGGPLTAPVLATPTVHVGRVELSWTDSNYEDSYAVERKPASATNWTMLASVGSNVLSFADTTVAPTASYSYRIKATALSVTSIYSNVRTVTTPELPLPSVPANLQALGATSAVLLAWSDANGEDGYVLERRQGTGDLWSVRAELAANVTSFTDQAVAPGNEYRYRIAASNGYGRSAYSAEAFAIPLVSLHPLLVLAEPASGGIMNGSGEFPEGTVTPVSAQAANGWIFLGWQDGSRTATRDVTVPAGGATFRALFRRLAVPVDFDGDSRSDVAVFRPMGGRWLVLESMGHLRTLQFGQWNTLPVTADYDGDLLADHAVFERNGRWSIVRSATASVIVTNWGRAGEIPVPADYDGDGRADLSVFDPSDGEWRIRSSLTRTVRTENWGGKNTMPVPADYDGDGIVDLAVYAPAGGLWHVLLRDGTHRSVNWGWEAALPVPADYDGDGRADLAVYAPGEGNWYVRGSRTGSSTVTSWGWSESAPVPADYDGDHRADLAVYAPREGNWYIQRSAGGTTVQKWGSAQAFPVLPQFLINRAFLPAP